MVLKVLGEVSPERLRTLIQRRNANTATADEIALCEHLATNIVDAYTAARSFKKVRQAPLLRLFFVSGSCAIASRELGISERTAQAWVAKFCEFVPGELTRAAQRQRDIDAARAQCQESCGRASRPAVSPDSAKRTRYCLEKLPKVPELEGGGRCPSCPLRALGL